MITELRQEHFPLDKLLALVTLSRSTYYYYCKHLSQPDKYATIKELIVLIFERNKGRYGYRRICAELRRSGCKINHKTVQKLMKSMELQGKQKKSKYRSYKGTVGKVASNVLDRNFHSQKPFEKLVTDVTEFKVCNERVYLSPVMDLFSHEIVAHSISLHPTFSQIREMLYKLFTKLPPDEMPLLHSDQGWQYQMSEYQEMLKQHNITQSMSRKGNCLDNSVMENFFGRLKTEMFFGETFSSVKDFIQKLEEYICYFNNERISLTLNGMSPVEYRTHFSVI